MSRYPKPTENLGVMYIAIGGRSLWQLRRSLLSLRHHCPNVPVALFTDQPADTCPDVEYRFDVKATGGYPTRRSHSDAGSTGQELAIESIWSKLLLSKFKRFTEVERKIELNKTCLVANRRVLCDTLLHHRSRRTNEGSC